jgi:hypothetical protein
VVLTAVWLAGLFGCLIGVESYIGHLRDGAALLVPEDRAPLLTPIATLYGSYLLVILGFWYKPLFPSPSNPRLNRIRFWFALIPAFLLNVIMVYLVWHGHFGSSTSTVQDDVGSAVRICGLLSFLAGPATAYYFGSRPQDGQ